MFTLEQCCLNFFDTLTNELMLEECKTWSDLQFIFRIIIHFIQTEELAYKSHEKFNYSEINNFLKKNPNDGNGMAEIFASADPKKANEGDITEISKFGVLILTKLCSTLPDVYYLNLKKLSKVNQDVLNNLISTFHNLDYDNIDEFWKNLFNDTKIPQHNESTSDSTLNASGESCLTNNFVCKSNNFSIFQCSESASLKKMLMSTAEKSNKRMQLEFKDNRIQNMEVQIDLLQDECAALEETVEKLKAKIDELKSENHALRNPIESAETNAKIEYLEKELEKEKSNSFKLAAALASEKSFRSGLIFERNNLLQRIEGKSAMLKAAEESNQMLKSSIREHEKMSKMLSEDNKVLQNTLISTKALYKERISQLENSSVSQEKNWNMKRAEKEIEILSLLQDSLKPDVQSLADQISLAERDDVDRTIRVDNELKSNGKSTSSLFKEKKTKRRSFFGKFTS